MSTRNLSLFEGERMSLQDSIDLTIQSLRAYALEYRHWAIAYSGGKDSSTLVSLVVWLIETKQIPAPETLTVLYADTRQEIPPLHYAAMEMLRILRDKGIDARVVLPKMDDRYFVYMFGRGVPPPNNGTLRWCTPQLKVEPMVDELKALRDRVGEKILMLTGVRVGESAARDRPSSISAEIKTLNKEEVGRKHVAIIFGKQTPIERAIDEAGRTPAAPRPWAPEDELDADTEALPGTDDGQAPAYIAEAAANTTEAIKAGAWDDDDYITPTA